MGNVSVWLIWSFNTVLSATYCAMALATFSTIYHVDSTMFIRLGVMASCFLGFVIVILFTIMSLLVLMKRVFRSRSAGGYGWMLASSLHVSFFMLLAALMLQGADSEAAGWKDAGLLAGSDYQVFRATFGFSYALAGSYALMFLLLLFGKQRFFLMEEDLEEKLIASASARMQSQLQAQNQI